MELLAPLIGFPLFCLLLLLALPVELSLHLEKEETLDCRARLQWLFGLVSVDLSAITGRTAKEALAEKPKKRKVLPTSLFGSETSLRRIMRLIRGLLHTLEIRELKLRGRIGLGDPAYTGMLMGLLHPLLLPGRNVALIADYQEAVFEGCCTARIRLFPIKVIGALLFFLFSRNR